MTATVTTPSGKFTVKFPAMWRNFRPIKTGELLSAGDRVVTASGRVLVIDDKYGSEGRVRATGTGKFSEGYYFRKAR